MKTLWIILLSIFVGGLLSMMLMRSYQQKLMDAQPEIVTDTIVVYRVDTIVQLVPKLYKVTKRDTLYLPSDGISSDTASNNVYIAETKVYKDSLLTAQITGINATLDWYQANVPVRTEYISSTVYVPPGRVSIGFQGGVGVTPKGVQPYIGVGVTYRLELKDMFKNLKRAK